MTRQFIETGVDFSHYRYIFFDLDGTLTNSGPGIARSLDYAMDKIGAPRLSSEICRLFIGPPLIDSFKRYCHFNDEETRRAIEFYREDYLSKGILENKVYPGIADMLAGLKALGKRLAVATAKPQPSAESVLERFDLLKFFDLLVGATFDGKLTKKADILRLGIERLPVDDKSEAVMVGDTIFDIEGARDVGIDSIGVSYGFGDVDEMNAAGTKAIVATAGELLELFAR